MQHLACIPPVLYRDILRMYLMICDFIDSARRAGVASLLFTLLPALINFIPDLTAVTTIIVGIQFPAFTICTAFKTFVGLETGFNNIQTGISFHNINTTGPNQVSLAQLLLIFLGQTAMFALLHFYFEKVLPSATASPLRPLFFLSSSYWSAAAPIDVNSQPLPASSTYEATEGVPCVRIRGLTKSFKKNGTAGAFEKPVWFKAVDGLNLDMYARTSFPQRNFVTICTCTKARSSVCSATTARARARPYPC